jgi:threonine dehydrogenase-like Zn-dependent dehydrogenase
MYEGRTDMPPGAVLGHENLGEVIEVGQGVDRVRVGDRVAIPFNIGCGFCANCERGLSAFCLTTADRSVMPNMAGAAYGFADMGPYRGGQAEFLRVPYGDYNCLVLPEDSKEKERDYVMLSDIFPTGWHATRLAYLVPGDSVVIYGSGPVGLMATLSAILQGASQVFVVDHNRDRLKVAEDLGATPIVEDEGREVDQILEATQGQGADCGCECIGYQCHTPKGKEVPNLVMNSLVSAVKFAGNIGVVGVFIPKDPGAPDDLAKNGELAFDFGKFWFKGQKIGTGQCNVKAYNRKLAELIHHDKAKPSAIISHDLPLTEAPNAYKNFDARLNGWHKVVLHPQAAAA